MPELREKQWLYHIYRQSPVAIGIYIGKDLVVEFANKKMFEIWGRKPDQMINKPLFEALPEVSGQGFEEILDNVFRTGKPYTGIENPATLEKDGKIGLYYFNILYEPLRDDNDEIYGIFQTAIDVTDYVESRKKAERDNEVLKSALEAGKMGTWYYDAIKRKHTTSLMHDQIFGYSEKQSNWTRDFFLNHILPEDRPHVLEKLEESYKTGILSYEARIQWKDKSIHWIQIKGKTTFNLAGKPISFSGIVVDITDQKKLEEKEIQIAVEQTARKEAEKQRKILYDLFMEAPAIICILRGPELVFELVNPPAQDTLFAGRKLLGLPLLEALPEMKGQKNLKIMEDIYATGKSFYGNEIPLEISKNNKLETFWFNFVQQPLFEPNGSISGIVTFAFDITEQINVRKELKETLDSLENKNRQLVKTNNDLDNFIYTASHDLKAPISNLEGLLTTFFSETEVEEEKRTFVKMMFDSIERFKMTIKDLTEITNVQKGGDEDRQVLDLGEMLQEVKDNIRTLIESKNATITSDFEVKEITYSRKNLRSILYNLISNGIKYSYPERMPIIHISTKRSGKYTVLSVKDNGLGMSESGIEKIFGMFKRLHDHVEGTGIGLYIVKRIIENAGGKIEVESEMDKGSEFKVFFLQKEK